MKYRVFTYLVPCDEAVAELNGFLSSHRILRVREEIVVKGSDPYLLFVVEYLDGPKRGQPAHCVIYGLRAADGRSSFLSWLGN